MDAATPSPANDEPAVRAVPTAPAVSAADTGRPTIALPLQQLVQLSIYWFGINSIWGAIDGVVLQARMPGLVGRGGRRGSRWRSPRSRRS